MKAHLLHPDADLDLARPLPWNADALTQDLGLETLFETMAQSDEIVLDVARKVVLAGVAGEPATIRYRQQLLRDALAHPETLRALFACATRAAERAKKHYLGTLERYPSWVLRGSIELLEALLESLRELRALAETHGGAFAAEGWQRFFAMVQAELSESYLVRVREHLKQLKFRGGLLLSARLGRGNQGSNYVLRQPHKPEGSWLERLLGQGPARLGFSLHPRDESGARALAELRDRGIADAARALAQAADHVRDFFAHLRAELAFYLGALNLHEALERKGEPCCFPEPAEAAARRFEARGLYDVVLALNLAERVVGNDVDANGKPMIVITGANQGGKSTFLRSVGLAQLMMQAGLFAPAEAFGSSVSSGLVTHYKREEDSTMESGKFDEELARMSEIVDHLAPGALLLFNESFAATNEREGSQIARQVVDALVSEGVRVAFVTHLYAFAHGLYRDLGGQALFLRAERRAGGERTFKLVPGEPLQTSFGEDLYRTIFGESRRDQDEQPPVRPAPEPVPES